MPDWLDKMGSTLRSQREMLRQAAPRVYGTSVAAAKAADGYMRAQAKAQGDILLEQAYPPKGAIKALGPLVQSAKDRGREEGDAAGDGGETERAATRPPPLEPRPFTYSPMPEPPPPDGWERRQKAEALSKLLRSRYRSFSSDFFSDQMDKYDWDGAELVPMGDPAPRGMSLAELERQTAELIAQLRKPAYGGAGARARDAKRGE